MAASASLRDITGMGYGHASLKDSALVMVDCQNTYRQGVMQLSNVEPVVKEAQKLLQMARDLHIPIIHIQHDAGVGTPYDVSAEIGQISAEVAPKNGEKVITKNYPNSFIATSLEADLKAAGVENVVLAGFMTLCALTQQRAARLTWALNPLWWPAHAPAAA